MDREHCLQQFLIDCAPADYRDQITVRIGRHKNHTITNDRLSVELQALEKLATEHPDLQRLISLLLSILTKPLVEPSLPRGGGERVELSSMLTSAIADRPPILPATTATVTGSDGAARAG